MVEKAKVLIIDDSEVDRKLFSQVLSKKGFTVIDKSSGKDILKIIAAEKPDILLLDVLLPDSTGNEMLHIIREKYTSIQLPIIMVTSKADSSDILESLFLGANDYIIKPIDFEVSLMRIYTQLKIVNLSKEMARLKEIETINAMIVTYNHELNNPLSIALGTMKKLLKSHTNDETFTRLENSLWRMVDIIKKIEQVKMDGEINYQSYNESTKHLKLD